MKKYFLVILINLAFLNVNAHKIYYSALDSLGKYELYNENGKKVLEKSYSWISVNNWDWIIAYNRPGISIFDSTGKLIPIQNIQKVGKVLESSLLIPIQSNNLWGFYDKSGVKIIDPIYDDIEVRAKEILVKKGDEIFYLDLNGKKSDKKYIPGKWDFVEMEEAIGLTTFENFPQEVFTENSKKGLRERETRKIILKPEFDEIYNLHQNRVIVLYKGKYGVMDFTGRWILSAKFDEIFVLD